MKKLLKAYGLNSDMQYLEMIVESVINGNRTQAKEQFKAMPKNERKKFIISICFYWDNGLSQRDKEMFVNEL